MLKTHIQRQIRQIFLFDRVLWLFKRPVFWRLTILVHGLMLVSALLFYGVESEVNPTVTSLTDALYWAVATATTVGYGDIVAVTTLGKWLAMALMVTGTLVSALYTALFATALMKPEIDEIELELMSEEKQMAALTRKLEQMAEKNNRL